MKFLKKVNLFFWVSLVVLLSACTQVEQSTTEKQKEERVEINPETEETAESPEKNTESPIYEIPEEAQEGVIYLEKLGFSPYLENYVLFCTVPNGFLVYSGYVSDTPNWIGTVNLGSSIIFSLVSDDLVYFYDESGSKYQLKSEGFVPLEE